jgi:hypothetical protein
MRKDFVGLMLLGCLGLGGCDAHSAPPGERVIIDLADGPASSFVPDDAFGAVIDGLSHDRVDQVYTPGNIQALQRAGLRPTAYTLRTELAIEAWHWSQDGTWSDPAHRQGYWTGSEHPSHAVLTGWGYKLPRRGDTTDQANDDGYSRIDDGNRGTFWKSNPYLDSTYTHRPSRDQWVIVSFPAATQISAIQLFWAQPFARRFEVQYWNGDDPYDEDDKWVTFPRGRVTNGEGADRLLRLTSSPIRTQYVRILLEQSSHTTSSPSHDARDAMGYAIRELEVGRVDRGGHFVDAIRHAPSGPDQTNIYVSSTDPWHRAIDRDPDVEQPGFDRIFSDGLTNNRPITLTVGALYDTPENTTAEMRFLQSRHYPVREVEVGLEPDGQNVSPEDYADLFVQTAAAIHAAAPHQTLAGPGLQDTVSDTWLDDDADHSWTHRFLVALTARGRMGDLGVFTFEHYPYDVLCGPAARKLVEEDATLDSGMERLRQDGVPATMPRAIIEYGMSAFSSRNNVEMPSALFDADMMAHFLTLGGRGGYMLGYGPEELFDPENACAGYGELMLFGQDAKGRATWPTPAFWSAALLTQQWAQQGGGRHYLYHASWHPARASPAWVVAYPVRRPDGRLAILLVNRDPLRSHKVQLDIARSAHGALADLPGPLELFQYGGAQYRWLANGAAGHPTRDDPPLHAELRDGPITLPPYSLSVVRTASGARF